MKQHIGAARACFYLRGKKNFSGFQISRLTTRLMVIIGSIAIVFFSWNESVEDEKAPFKPMA